MSGHCEYNSVIWKVPARDQSKGPGSKTLVESHEIFPTSFGGVSSPAEKKTWKNQNEALGG